MAVLDLPKNTNQLSGEVGKDFLIYLDKGAKRPSWVLLGGQRGLTLNRTAEEIDISNKTTGGWMAKKTGLRSWSIDADGIVVLNDKGVQIAETAFNEGKEVHVKCEYPDKKYCEGWGSITDFSMDAPSDGEATISMTIAGNGPIKISDKPTGIYLDGISTYITLPKELLAGKSIYTIELSFSTTQKVASSADWSAPCICGMLNYGGNIVAITNNDGYVSLGVSGGNVGRELMADGQVHNVAIISDGTIIKGYHNNKQYEQTRESKSMDNVPINFGIGLPQCRSYAECTIYEARFWEVARKPEELGNKITGNESGLRAWYRCWELSGNVLKDSSSNKFDGTIVGNVWG